MACDTREPLSLVGKLFLAKGERNPYGSAAQLRHQPTQCVRARAHPRRHRHLIDRPGRPIICTRKQVAVKTVWHI